MTHFPKARRTPDVDRLGVASPGRTFSKKIPGLRAILLNRCPQWWPNAFWLFSRNTRRVTLAIGCGAIIAVIGTSWHYLISLEGGLRDHSITSTLWLHTLALTVVVLANTFFWRRTTRQYDRFVRANDCLVCFECGYVLHGLPKFHVCPECGAEYEFDDLKRRWEDWLGGRKG